MADEHFIDGLTGARGTRVSFERGQSIYGEGDPATSFYKVTSGAVASYRVLNDGRRQITAFHLVDDIFGVETTDERRFSAEALERTSALAFAGGWAGRSLLVSDERLRGEVAAAIVVELRRTHEHAVLLGRKTAVERVASFLLEMSERMESDTFRLPMSRLDIGDYLGCTTETVARTLSQLDREGIIGVSDARRTVRIRNKRELRRLCEFSQEGR